MNLANRESILEYLKSNTTYIDDCWIYNIYIMDGYGHIKINGKTYGVHNISAYYFLGLELDNPKLQPNHKPICTNRACWNPDHLYVGTQYQNSQDTREAGNYHNQKKTHCPKGHLLTGTTSGPSTDFRVNRYCKVCRAEQKLKIRKAKKNAKGK